MNMFMWIILGVSVIVVVSWVLSMVMHSFSGRKKTLIKDLGLFAPKLSNTDISVSKAIDNLKLGKGFVHLINKESFK